MGDGITAWHVMQGWDLSVCVCVCVCVHNVCVHNVCVHVCVCVCVDYHRFQLDKTFPQCVAGHANTPGPGPGHREQAHYGLMRSQVDSKQTSFPPLPFDPAGLFSHSFISNMGGNYLSVVSGDGVWR